MKAFVQVFCGRVEADRDIGRSACAKLSQPSWGPQSSGIHLLAPGSNQYSRVLDYSIFKSLLVPYPKNFTTRPSSRVVIVLTFYVQSYKYSDSGKVKLFWWTHISPPATKFCNYSNVYLSLLWDSWGPLNVEGDKSTVFYRQFNSKSSTTPMLHQPLRITITISMQLGTM